MTKQRRSNRGSILRQSNAGWQISAALLEPVDWHAMDVADPSDPLLIANAAADFVASHGLSRNVALALESESVLAAKFIVANSAERRDRRVMSYRLEELLPVAAEDFAADYLTEGIDILGMATPLRDILPLVMALEEQGLQVQSIAPKAITAMQAFGDFQGMPSSDFVLWQDADCMELFRVGRRISDWRHLPADSASVVRHFGAVLLRSNSPIHVTLLDVDPLLRDALGAMAEIEVEVVDTLPLDEYARRGAASALVGKSKPWIEFRRDKLVAGDPHRALRREWQWCQWSLALLLISIAFFFGMRGRQYEQQVASLQVKQEALFQQVFPSSRIPNAVLSRLRSERAKLLGARGGDAAVEQPLSALNVLHEFITGIPSDLRLRVQQLRIEDAKVYLDATVRTVGDAGELADALAQQGFAIDPPTTEQFDAKQVSIRINGILPAPRSESGR